MELICIYLKDEYKKCFLNSKMMKDLNLENQDKIMIETEEKEYYYRIIYLKNSIPNYKISCSFQGKIKIKKFNEKIEKRDIKIEKKYDELILNYIKLKYDIIYLNQNIKIKIQNKEIEIEIEKENIWIEINKFYINKKMMKPIGYDKEIERIKNLIELKKKISILISGPHGVGKTLLLKYLKSEYFDKIEIEEDIKEKKSFKNILIGTSKNKKLFDFEIELNVPNEKQRYEILKYYLKEMKQEELQYLSEITIGYVGYDIYLLCQQSCHNLKELIEIKNKMKPSSLKEIILEIPKITWNDIGGKEEIKKYLKENISLKNEFKPKGILLYGYPGNGKTFLVKALANESKFNFIAIKGPEIFNKYVGESEKMIQEIFKKARLSSPCIIFFDEIDAIALERGNSNSVGDRVLSQLLNEIDGIDSLQDVIIIGATNRPDVIDKALLRPGRMDRILFIDLPNDLERKEIFQIYLKKISHSDDIDLNELVHLSKGYSAAEISSLFTIAGYLALEQDLNSNQIQMSHLKNSFQNLPKRTINSEIYSKFHQLK